MIKDIYYYGNPVLRKKAEPVSQVNEEVRQLANDLIDTMDAHNGIGLAATQIGVLQRVFVIRLEFVGKHGEFVKGIPKIYINPKILEYSDDVVTLSEACMSLPKLSVDVDRPEWILIEALDLDGNLFQEKIEGFPARQFMHENDHLNGTLIIDRCPKKQKDNLLPLLQRIKKQYNAKNLK